jgi:SAM-dependent methyltransferase
MPYFGIFKQLRDLNMSICEENDLYKGNIAKIYDVTTETNNKYELEIYKKHAAICKAPILELACGSGRILLDMARAGYNITGIDLSEDMLDLLREKISVLPNRIKSRIDIHCSNMKDFKFDKKFGLIILPATTICLLKNRIEMEEMFLSVFNHLKDGGRFIFDYAVSNIDSVETVELPVKIWTGETKEYNKQFVLYGERKCFLESKSIVNFYSEIEVGDQTKRLFGFTEKNMINQEVLKDIIQKTGFKILAIIDNYFTLETEQVKVAILEKNT